MKRSLLLGRLLFSALGFSSSAFAQNLPPELPTFGNRLGTTGNPQPTNTVHRELWAPDSAASRLRTDSTNLFLAGGFQNVGQSTGGCARLALADASVDTTWPRTDGPVYSIVSDGVGGWFLGGNFSLVENVARRCVAHVFSNGVVDTGFDAQVSANKVRTLLLANGVLYIAGGIGPVSGAARQALCAVNAQTGALLSWNPILGPSWGSSSEIYTLAIFGDRVYVGGSFQETVQGVARKHLMWIDRLSGVIDAWNPAPDSGVFDSSLDGSDLVLAGNFDQILGVSRSKVAAIDAATGSLTPFSTTFSSTVWSVKLDAGTLFAGGSFATAGGIGRSRAAAFNFNSSSLLRWNPDLNTPIGGGLSVYDIETAGGDVVLAGCFTMSGSDVREDVAIVDRTLGGVRPWHSMLAGGTPTTAYCARLDGAAALIGGDFNLANGLSRRGLCALSIASGAPTAWNPIAPGTQETLQIGDTVYLAGSFAAVNGVPRRLLAAVDAATGTTTLPFDVTSSLPVGVTSVRALAYGNGILYAGGDFHTTDNRFGLMALDPATGARIPGWNTNIGGSLNDIALSQDGLRLYVGGVFSGVGIPLQPRQNFAVIDALTGAVLPMITNANLEVRCVMEAAGRVYIGGAFNTINGQIIPRLAQINPATGIAYDWSPMLNPGGGSTSVEAIARFGRLIYVAGGFTQVNGVWNPNLGAVDAQYAIKANWAPAPSSSLTAVATSLNRVFVSGGFRSIAGTATPYLAEFDIQ